MRFVIAITIWHAFAPLSESCLGRWCEFGLPLSPIRTTNEGPPNSRVGIQTRERGVRLVDGFAKLRGVGVAPRRRDVRKGVYRAGAVPDAFGDATPLELPSGINQARGTVALENG